jgi:hypothetical protein
VPETLIESAFQGNLHQLGGGLMKEDSLLAGMCGKKKPFFQSFVLFSPSFVK